MNKAKAVFWLIVLGFISLMIFQNQEFFLKPASLRMNLFFARYETPDLPGAIYFISFFVLGLLIAYFFSLYAKFKANQIIRDLNSKIAGQTDTIAKLGEELAALKAAMEEKGSLDSDDTPAAPEPAEDPGSVKEPAPGNE